MNLIKPIILILALAVSVSAQQGLAAIPDSDNVIPNPQIVTYANAKDLFGKGIADRYIIWQVTVSNTDESRQFQITNLIADYDPGQCQAVENLYPKFNLTDCEAKYNLYFTYPAAYAPAQQRELLGVAEVRQIKSPRATFFRVLDFGITMAGAMAPFNFIGRDGRSGIGILAGTGVGAIQRLFPDLAPNQLQRLAAMSYDGKTIVGPQQASTFLVFIPAELVFSSANWKEFKSGGEVLRLAQLFATAQVTGSFITATPQVTVRSGFRR